MLNIGVTIQNRLPNIGVTIPNSCLANYQTKKTLNSHPWSHLQTSLEGNFCQVRGVKAYAMPHHTVTLLSESFINLSIILNSARQEICKHEINMS